MGVDVEVKPIDWDSKDMELSSGKIDVIWNGFSITDERRQEVLFSNPYLSTKQSIVVKKGSDITKKADLAGKKIALQDGSTSEDALKADTATYESVGDDNICKSEVEEKQLQQKRCSSEYPQIHIYNKSDRHFHNPSDNKIISRSFAYRFFEK